MKSSTSILCAMVVSFWVGLPEAQAGKSAPNVILIMTDDQGYGDLSCHGNPVLKTPNLDKLHSQSVRFTDFHVAPMCSPTRGQLLSGRDAMKNGATAVCQGRSMMRSELPTMANLLAAAGYATGMFGKWHLGDSYPHRPQDRGFQEVLSFRAWGITSLADHWQNSYFNPTLLRNGKSKKYQGYCTDIFFTEAMKWMKQCQTQKKPFFAYIPTNTPHVPNVVAPKYSVPYKGTHKGKPIPSEFFGMIANIDENIGKLERFLEEHNLRDNTILIFLSDNGTQSAQAQALFNAGMRARKTSVYEGGHRVPLFVRWTNGKLQHGTDIGDLTTVQDLLPTILDLCGVDPPKTDLDGVSLAGLLKGTQKHLEERKLVIQYRVSGAKWDSAVVMKGKWRLIGSDQLFDLKIDPHQDTNIAEQHPQIVRELATHYAKWYAEAKPLFDRPRWITVGSDNANPMMLYGQDWVGGYCDNRGNLMRATALGYWNVIVDQAGDFELELRRWPAESNIPLASGLGKTKTDGARPIAAAEVQIAGQTYKAQTKAEDARVTFRVTLKPGKQQLATTFYDKSGNKLCSAIYLKLTRLGKSARTEPKNRRPEAASRTIFNAEAKCVNSGPVRPFTQENRSQTRIGSITRFLPPLALITHSFAVRDHR